MNKHLILIDERRIIQYGLKAFIESASNWRVLFSAKNKDELVMNLEEQTSFSPSDIFAAIVDIKCGKDSGFDIINILKNKIPELKCIIYTEDCFNYRNLMYAFEKGIDGFLSKNSDESELIFALDAVSRGDTYIQQDLMKKVLLLSNKISCLTFREKQVFDLICDGHTKKDICKTLRISIRTCENYLSVLYSKLNVSNTKEIQKKYGSVIKSNYLNGSSDYFETKLTLVQDNTYTGDGVKILYKNIPKDASVVEISIHNTGTNSHKIAFSYMNDSEHGLNREYYRLGYYVYPYLNAGSEYIFDAVFKTQDNDIVDRASISVIPKKGEEIYIKMANKNNIIINPETFECTIKDIPLPNLPSDACFGVTMWTPYMQYIGKMTQKISEIKELGSYNFYKDIDCNCPSIKLKSVKKVLFYFYFSYKCYEWNFFVSEIYPFSKNKLLPTPETNFLKFPI